MKKLILFSLIVLIGLFTVQVRAEEETTPSSEAPKIQNRKEVIEKRQDKVKQNIETQNAKREEIQEKNQAKMEALKAKREENLEKIKTKQDEFKAKMTEIKDERKQKIAEQVNTQMTHLNQQITTKLTNTLIRLRALLDKLSARSEKAEVKTAIETASGLIVKAEEAVQAQASKDYTIVFTDETDLKAGASTAKQQLKADLEAVRAEVKTAHQAVIDVLQMLKEAK